MKQRAYILTFILALFSSLPLEASQRDKEEEEGVSMNTVLHSHTVLNVEQVNKEPQTNHTIIQIEDAPVPPKNIDEDPKQPETSTLNQDIPKRLDNRSYSAKNCLMTTENCLEIASIISTVATISLGGLANWGTFNNEVKEVLRFAGFAAGTSTTLCVIFKNVVAKIRLSNK